MNKLRDIGLIDLLDAALIEKYDKEQETPQYNPLRPSSAGVCETALAFKWLEWQGKLPVTPDPREASVIRLLDLGHAVEKSLINQFYTMAKAFNFSVKYLQHKVDVFTLDDGTIIEGSIDFCVESNDGSTKILCDSKSKKDAFSKVFKTKFDEDKYKFAGMKTVKCIGDHCFYIENILDFMKELGVDFIYSNIAQINSYVCSDFFKKRGYTECSLIYYNKNDSRCYELRFKANDELNEKVKNKFNNAKKSTDPLNDTTKTYMIGSCMCSFCPYASKCWSEDSKKAFFKTLPGKSWPIRIGSTECKNELRSLFATLEEFSDKKDRENVENLIAKIMYKHKLYKIELDNNNVYELKILKNSSRIERSKA